MGFNSGFKGLSCADLFAECQHLLSAVHDILITQQTHS